MGVHSVNIMGEGSLSGGNYKKVKIMGEAEVIGSFESESLTVMGELTTEFDIKTGKMSIMGEGNFQGVEAEAIRIAGEATYKGFVRVRDISVSGEAIFKDSVKANKIKVLGNMEVQNSVETEIFKSKGAFQIGTLNSNVTEIRLYGDSRVSEMGGESVEVIYPWHKKLISGLVFKNNWRAQLRADSIEADVIYLENTIAKSVKGNDVKIGPGCKIERVEYGNTIHVDSRSSVEHSEKV